ELTADESAELSRARVTLPLEAPASPMPQPSANSAKEPAPDEKLSPEVARMVELLLKGSDGAVRISPAPNPDRPSKTGPLREPAVPNSTSIGAKPVEEPVSGWTGNKTATAFTSDPSYVFFRQIPDSEGGPLGALGVPLTAGRSVAVDPRTTPLGFPVFISTEGQTLSSRMSRLMFAQDT